MVTKAISIVVAVLAALIWVEAEAQAPTSINGQVVEINASGMNVGLPAVEIVLRTPDGRKMNATPSLTRPNGNFSIPLRLDELSRLRGGTIEYRKEEYVADPEIRRITDPTKPQAVVGMIKTSMNAAYYEGALRQIAALAPGPERTASLSTAASLPPRDRALVESALRRGTDATLMKEFTVAEEAVAAKQGIFARLTKQNFENVVAWPNYPSAGNVWLGGSVKTQAQLKDLRAFSATFPTAVFDVGVKPDGPTMEAKK